MEEKKFLNIEEIESQTILELPDRPVMQAEQIVNFNILTFLIEIFGG